MQPSLITTLNALTKSKVIKRRPKTLPSNDKAMKGLQSHLIIIFVKASNTHQILSQY